MSSPGVGGITSGGDKLQLDNFKPRFQIAAWLRMKGWGKAKQQERKKKTPNNINMQIEFFSW